MAIRIDDMTLEQVVVENTLEAPVCIGFKVRGVNYVEARLIAAKRTQRLFFRHMDFEGMEIQPKGPNGQAVATDYQINLMLDNLHLQVVPG